MKGNRITSFFAGLIFLATSTSVMAQNANNDFLVWNSIGLTYKLNKKIKLSLEGHLRMKEDAKTIDEHFTQFEAQYELLEDFDIVVGGRYIFENDNQGKKQGYENHLRYHIDLKYKVAVNQLDIRLRARYQNKNELGISELDGDLPTQNIRFKTSFDYDITNWPIDPEFSAEVFQRAQKGEGFRYSKIRLTLGTSYKIEKIGKFGVFYRYEDSARNIIPNEFSILGFKYTYYLN